MPNRLLPTGNYSYHIIKILFKKRRDHGKKFVYESVDDESLSLGYISKFEGKKVSASNGLN